ncbi:MFS transporter [Brevibacterium album]|uniref:MFS transporter n=1 Tax=Brevibacterium album TaxID=417948 RepID=UPI00040CAB6E|nr:MFS transporter [Brevibacterium album]
MPQRAPVHRPSDSPVHRPSDSPGTAGPPPAGPGSADSGSAAAGSAPTSAIRGGIWGNYVDQIAIFLPLTALAPAMVHIVGPEHAATSTSLALIATLLGRPVGAMLFGRLADRHGRTSITRWAIAGTALFTLLIAALPTHAALGAGTLVLLFAFRFLGGMCLAGEYTSAIPLAMEWARPRSRGLFSGLIMAMAPWAQATIALATAVSLAVLGPEAYAVFGWRIAFAAGGLASLAMLVYYHLRVADAHTAPAEAAAQSRAGAQHAAAAGSLRSILAGSWAGAFWQVFTLMTGLWLMTNMVVVHLTSALGSGFSPAVTSPASVPLLMVAAGCAQALAMSCTGHLSTRLGRRRYFVLAGLLAAVAGPLCLAGIAGAQHIAAVVVLACAVQALTVSAYGPVGAYINERFPAHLRSTGYGSAYSLSIIVPALFPFWLPPLGGLLGSDTTAVLVVAGTGGLLLALAGACGPALRPAQLDQSLDELSAQAIRDRSGGPAEAGADSAEDDR